MKEIRQTLVCKKSRIDRL